MMMVVVGCMVSVRPLCASAASSAEVPPLPSLVMLPTSAEASAEEEAAVAEGEAARGAATCVR